MADDNKTKNNSFVKIEFKKGAENRVHEISNKEKENVSFNSNKNIANKSQSHNWDFWSINK